ncbi:hypothetical protein ANCCAN_26093 [Ancylostoma caninum]|uniref:Uncharacterized protein n=1 Tax=Ancylostoma caninum TaxID=29170 RepID=A0A368FB01_ANCCA|nr:hypothetical protein ANCCAN_26093 [Ancylostoma caninum]
MDDTRDNHRERQCRRRCGIHDAVVEGAALQSEEHGWLELVVADIRCEKARRCSPRCPGALHRCSRRRHCVESAQISKYEHRVLRATS